MARTAPSLGRILTMVLFALSCFGLLLFLWLSFGGSIPFKPKGYQFKVSFPEATQLAQEADVRVAGVSVGKVRGKELDPEGNRTIATIEVDPRYAPINADATAILRQKTLLGETYVELTPGHHSAGTVKEGALLARSHVEKTVELDEILGAFDPQTQAALRDWQQTLAVAIKGNGRNLNNVLGNLPTFAANGADLLRVLDVQHTALTGLVRDGGAVFEAISRDPAALRALFTGADAVFAQTAAQQQALSDSIDIFPTFLDESKATFARLKTFALNTDPLVKDLRPVAQDLVPTLRDVRALAPDLRILFVRLDPLITAARTGLPALSSVIRGLTPMLGQLAPFLEQLNPILEYLSLYQHFTADFISQGAAALASKTASASGGVGHTLSQIQPLGLQTLGIFPVRSPDNRGNTYLPPDAFTGAQDVNMGKYLTLPSWDCKNAPGGGIDTPTFPKAGLMPLPGCWTEKLPAFHGANGRFPHVTADSYPTK